MTKKRILLVSGIQVFPPISGGHLRTVNLAKALSSEGFDVEIFSLTGRREEYLRGAGSARSKISDNVTEFVYRGKLFGLMQFVSYKLGWPPIWLTYLARYFVPSSLSSKLEYAEHVIWDFPFVFNLARKSPSAINVLNTHNIESELYNSSFWKKVVGGIEARALANADFVLFSSRRDFEKSRLNESKASIIPNGLDLNDYSHAEKNAIKKLRDFYDISNNSKVIVFSASKYPANVVALNNLCNWVSENEDLLRKESVFFLVVGSVSEKDKRNKFIRFEGRVEDMLPYFQMCDYFINPVTSGSGVNVKMMEYIAMRKPILSTRFGARGLHLEHKKSCFYFDFDDLRQVLIEALANKDIYQMTEKAFDDNLHSISMSKSVSQMLVKQKSLSNS